MNPSMSIYAINHQRTNGGVGILLTPIAPVGSTGLLRSDGDGGLCRSSTGRLLVHGLGITDVKHAVANLFLEHKPKVR